ncbi:T9SS type A sorting domain-containing protein [bacterium]|nr:T9SS type A sorting domain-containing protein [bacterium]
MVDYRDCVCLFCDNQERIWAGWTEKIGDYWSTKIKCFNGEMWRPITTIWDGLGWVPYDWFQTSDSTIWIFGTNGRAADDHIYIAHFDRITWYDTTTVLIPGTSTNSFHQPVEDTMGILWLFFHNNDYNKILYTKWNGEIWSTPVFIYDAYTPEGLLMEAVVDERNPIQVYWVRYESDYHVTLFYAWMVDDTFSTPESLLTLPWTAYIMPISYIYPDGEMWLAGGFWYEGAHSNDRVTVFHYYEEILDSFVLDSNHTDYEIMNCVEILEDKNNYIWVFWMRDYEIEDDEIRLIYYSHYDGIDWTLPSIVPGTVEYEVTWGCFDAALNSTGRLWVVWNHEIDDSISAKFGSYLIDTTFMVEDTSIYLQQSPNDFSLEIFPNPFNDLVNIKINLDLSCGLQVDIYNIYGEKVYGFMEQKIQPGIYNFTWNAVGNPSGLYFCRSRNGDYEQVHKILLIR